MNATSTSTSTAPIRPLQPISPSESRPPLSLSRLSHEFTLFPSYEAMHLANNIHPILPSPALTFQSTNNRSSISNNPLQLKLSSSPSIPFIPQLHRPPLPHSDSDSDSNSYSNWANYLLPLALTLALLGSHIPFILALLYALPFLIKLKLSPTANLLLWLAFPLAGLLVPPLLGSHADLHRGPYRRRRSIAISTLALAPALLLLAFCQPLAAALTYLLPRDAGDWDPARQTHIHAAAIAIGLGALYLVAFALTALTHAARALVLDQLPANAQMHANASIARLTSLAAVVVFALVCASDAPHGPGEPALLRLLIALALPALLACSAATCLSQPERPPPSVPAQPSQPSLRHQAALLVHSLRTLPVPVRRVCMVQLLSALCSLTTLYHAKPLVAHLVLAERTALGAPLDARLVRFAERQGSKAMLAFSLVSLLTSIALPWISTAGTTRYIATRQAPPWNLVRQVLMLLTPRNLWTASLAIYGLLMGSTFWIETSRGASVLVGLLGGCWAVAHWVPLGLVMEYVRSIEETAPTTPQPPSPPPSPHTPGPKRERRVAVEVPGRGPGQDGRSCATLTGGTMVAAYELAGVGAHLVVTILSSLALDMAELLRTRASLRRPESPDSPAIIVGGPTARLWLFRLTGLVAIGAAGVAWKAVVVPTSELEYWDELGFQVYESLEGNINGGGGGGGAVRLVEDED